MKEDRNRGARYREVEPHEKPATAQSSRPQTASAGESASWEDHHGYTVIDKDGARIGHLAGAWEDESGQTRYLAVRTGWIFGRTHLAPLEGARVERTHRVVVLPHSEAHVKTAPDCEPGHAMTRALDDAVCRHYGLGTRTRPSGKPAGPRGETQTESESVTIPLAEERIVLGKRQVEAGGIRLRKVVRTEIVHQPIELRREEIIIERVPGREGQASTTNIFNEEVIFVPIHREEAIVGKEARIREEVRVRKTAHTEQKDIEEQVRKEDIEVLDSDDRV